MERYETSALLTDAHKAALGFVDALIWTPAHISADIAAGVRSHFTDEQAIEITLDVMRNACNKIAVGPSAPTHRGSQEGTERDVVGADGQPVYSS
ncbi:MAG: hypothetical protein ABWY45_22840 [Mycobacterium sp.]